MFAIFESMNEPAIDGLPRAAMEYAEFGGLCDKIMIVHPGKFCSAHFHWRKTEYYEVVLGEMDLFYSPEIIDFPDLGIIGADVIQRTPMPEGDPWPDDVVLAAGREEAWRQLTSYKRLRKGDPKFLMPRKHLHGFGCPADARTPLVVRENSGYSHEPTEVGKSGCCPNGRASTTTTSLPRAPTAAAWPTTSARSDRSDGDPGAASAVAIDQCRRGLGHR